MADYEGKDCKKSVYIGWLHLSETVDVDTNASTISWEYRLYRPDYTSKYHYDNGNHCTLVVDGVEVYSRTGFSVDMGGTATSRETAVLLGSGSFTVNHNQDGTKGISIYANYWNTQSDTIGSSDHPLSAGGSYTCQTIPRASSLTVPAESELGQTINITINRARTGFTDTITYAVGGNTGTIVTKTSNTSINWTPSVADFAPNITTSPWGGCVLTVTTYNGDTLVGSKTANVILRVPDNADTRPTLSVTATPTGPFASHNIFLQGSRATITFEDDVKYGANIASRTIDSAAISGASGESPELQSTKNYVCRTTDSRGFSTTYDLPITVTPYAKPYIPDTYTITRCKSTGEEATDGTYIKVLCNEVHTLVNGLNSVTMTVAYRLKGGIYSSEESITPGTAKVIGSGDISVQQTYEVRVILTDTAGNSYVLVNTIGPEAILLHLRPGGKGLGIGTRCSADNTLEINPDWVLKPGNLPINKLVPYLMKTDEFTTPTWYKPADQNPGYVAWDATNGVLDGFIEIGAWVYVHCRFHYTGSGMSLSDGLRMAQGFPLPRYGMAALAIGGTASAKWSTCYVDGYGILWGKLDAATTTEHWVSVTGFYKKQ